MHQCVMTHEADSNCHFFDSARHLIEWLEAHLTEVDLMSLDHDLHMLSGTDGRLVDPGDGRDVAAWLAVRKPTCPVIVHTSNGPAASAMRFTLESAGWHVSRVIPDADLAWVEAEWLPVLQTLLGT